MFCFVLFHFSSSNRNNFPHSNDNEHLGAGITFFNSFIFASFNCKSIPFQFIKKDLLVCFIFININLKDKSCKIFFGETLAVLECNLCQLSNVISRIWTFKVISYSWYPPSCPERTLSSDDFKANNAIDTIYFSHKIGLTNYYLVYLGYIYTTVTQNFRFLLSVSYFLATKSVFSEVDFCRCI